MVAQTNWHPDEPDPCMSMDEMYDEPLEDELFRAECISAARGVSLLLLCEIAMQVDGPIVRFEITLSDGTKIPQVAEHRANLPENREDALVSLMVRTAEEQA